MNKIDLYNFCKAEERVAYIHGWDFSHLNNRFTEETDLPWNYDDIVRSYLLQDYKLLDIDTGGGEYLLSLKHPFSLTSATEAYAPNVDLCKSVLLPLGIAFKKANDYSNLPFDDNSFDMIINRHGNYNIEELYRLLKHDGIFITEQVGENNDRELIELLLPELEKPMSKGLYLAEQKERFSNCSFEILKSDEAYRPIKFFDTGALVWFARIIQWEFPNFSVDDCFDRLLEAEKIKIKNGCIEGTIHRYLLVVKKV
ncbi:MAG: class I SAM-dependent methyltransferase [Clostridium sp.]|nr:class I SAM-dependent methyltransferase [Clostridium sp.]